MNWNRLLAYITGSVDQEVLLCNEYSATKNRILRNQIKGRLRLTDPEPISLAEIGKRLGQELWKRWPLMALRLRRDSIQAAQSAWVDS